MPMIHTGAPVDGNFNSALAMATTGAYDAGFKYAYTNRQAITSGRLCAMSINCEPKAGVDAKKIVGGEVCTYLGATVEVSGSVHGMFVETQGGGTLSGDFYSLYVYAAPSAVPGGSSGVMRLENNATADNRLETFIAFVGGYGSYAMTFGPLQTQTAWAYTGDKTGSSTGWLKVLIGSAVRYIQLYT